MNKTRIEELIEQNRGRCSSMYLFSLVEVQRMRIITIKIFQLMAVIELQESKSWLSRIEEDVPAA